MKCVNDGCYGRRKYFKDNLGRLFGKLQQGAEKREERQKNIHNREAGHQRQTI